jgi:hypothetical protein
MLTHATRTGSSAHKQRSSTPHVGTEADTARDVSATSTTPEPFCGVSFGMKILGLPVPPGPLLAVAVGRCVGLSVALLGLADGGRVGLSVALLGLADGGTEVGWGDAARMPARSTSEERRPVARVMARDGVHLQRIRCQSIPGALFRRGTGGRAGRARARMCVCVCAYSPLLLYGVPSCPRPSA